MSKKKRWKPLLPKEIRQWVKGELSHFNSEFSHQIRRSKISNSIENGFGAVAIYLSYSAAQLEDSSLKQSATEIMEFVTQKEKGIFATFYGGYFGSLWLSNYFQTHVVSKSKSGTLDKLIQKRLPQYLNQVTDTDFTVGLSGVITAMLSGDNKKYVYRSIPVLFEQMRMNKEGYWVWPMVKRKMKPIKISKRFESDLGLAHGMPGILLLCAYVKEIYPSCFNREYRLKLDSAVQYIQHVEDKFPHKRFTFFSDDTDRITPRSAWCYGDAGVGRRLCR